MTVTYFFQDHLHTPVHYPDMYVTSGIWSKEFEIFFEGGNYVKALIPFPSPEL